MKKKPLLTQPEQDAMQTATWFDDKTWSNKSGTRL